MLYQDSKVKYLMFAGLLLAPFYQSRLENLLETIGNLAMLVIGILLAYRGAKILFASSDAGRTGSGVTEVILLLIGVGLILGGFVGIERLSAFYDLLMDLVEGV